VSSFRWPRGVAWSENTEAPKKLFRISNIFDQNSKFVVVLQHFARIYRLLFSLSFPFEGKTKISNDDLFYVIHD